MQRTHFRVNEFISKVYCSRETIEAAIKATSQKDRWNGMEKQLNEGKRLVSIFRGRTLQRDRVQYRLGLIEMNQHALTYFKNGPSLSDLMQCKYQWKSKHLPASQLIGPGF